MKTNVKASVGGAQRIAYCLKRKPIITSLMNVDELPSVLETDSNIVFILKTDIFVIESVVEQIREAGKLSFVHFDLIEGIGKDKTGVAYLAEKVGIDGIVTTKKHGHRGGEKAGLADGAAVVRIRFGIAGQWH
ncbi:glycerol-3-phosphate responsive antiterminator [Paenibacillus sp. DMB20]|uniref:glycerol-3-phosphate responsive antiterminator n=1 Tax=Paenibacillus sp. DMB20 TaxID=1642570 RepID=UPI000A3F8428|nr:glycerol-3-phosphate responsive antiterminator [Paenibacillus sp. DMB20]